MPLRGVREGWADLGPFRKGPKAGQSLSQVPPKPIAPLSLFTPRRWRLIPPYLTADFSSPASPTLEMTMEMGIPPSAASPAPPAGSGTRERASRSNGPLRRPTHPPSRGNEGVSPPRGQRVARGVRTACCTKKARRMPSFFRGA